MPADGRVLVVTNDFPPRRGGIESFVLALCERMPPDEVVVYTPSMPGDAELDARLPFPVHRDPARRLLPTPAVSRRVREVLHREHCDRVLFGASVPLGLLAPALRRAGATRLVALTHGHEVWWARLPPTRAALRRVGDSVDVMTYVSDWCRDRIAPALSPAARSRMQRLSPGVDRDMFRPGCGGAEKRAELGIRADAPVVVCTARLARRKGQDTLLRAWPRLLERRPDAVLLLVGDGPARAGLKRLAASLGVSGSVVTPGGVDWVEVPAFVDAGDVFAMPCRTRRGGLEPEAWGIASLEAQACGLPVVVGRSGGAPETLASPSSGQAWEPGDGDLADVLDRWLSREVDSRLTRPEPVVVPWTWDRAAERLRELWVSR
jgi:phosphatidylinositol alpha-1,6-mannosyltransferase